MAEIRTVIQSQLNHTQDWQEFKDYVDYWIGRDQRDIIYLVFSCICVRHEMNYTLNVIESLVLCKYDRKILSLFYI